MAKKAKLKFVDWGTSRPRLTPEEARWWRDFFVKTIKIGFELEYNLPKNVGVCSGKSLACPCTREDKEERQCYAKCAIGPNNCTLISDPKECPGIYCVEFRSPCLTCTEAVHDCASCTFFVDPEKDPSAIRARIIGNTSPSSDLSRAKGVFSVTTDGSLTGDGGIEVVTVGRRVDFNKFRQQLTELMGMCHERGAFVDERTSVHMHMLVGYYNLVSSNGTIKATYKKKGTPNSQFVLSELEENIPEVILANFHQLIRRYHNALTWMTSSGDDKYHLTRWMKFRQPVLEYSSLTNNMAQVIAAMRNGISDGGRYAFVNYHKVGVDRGGNVNKFHIEARYTDGSLSPTAVSAFGVLLHALLLKAAAISVYGILNAGEKEYMREARAIMKSLLNNNGGYGGPRFSTTDGVWVYENALREQSREMVFLLRSELSRFPGAYDVLLSLADKPCSVRRINGESWEHIEKELKSLCENSFDEGTKKILKVVDTAYIAECDSQEHWFAEVSEDMQMPKPDLYDAVEKLVSNGYIRWDEQTGAFVRY